MLTKAPSKTDPADEPGAKALFSRGARAAPAAIPRALAESLDRLGLATSFARKAEIYAEDDPAEHFYRVIRGAVRTCTVWNDGRRQIGAFHLPGDVFGLESSRRHRLTAEAITDSTVLVIERSALAMLAVHDNDVANALWTMTARQLERMQNLQLVLGRRNAQKRVGAFLLEMAARSPEAELVALPMPRRDIADYLGLTIETVSRTLRKLRKAGVIDLPSARRVVLRDPPALRRLAA